MARHITIGLGRHRFDLANITVEPVLFLYMFSLFLNYSAFQALVFNKVCLQTYTPTFCDIIQHNETYKEEHKSESNNISTETSYWILKANFVMTIPSFFMVILFLGALGDKYGRKLPVILPCIGALAGILSNLLNAKYMSSELSYILIGPAINGLSGGYIACLMAVYSYVSHISTLAKKLTRISILESMIFLSGTVGVLVSGVMLDRQGYVFTFSAVLISVGIALIYAILWLDNVQAVTTDNQSQGFWRILMKFFKDSFHCVKKRREGTIFSALLLMILAVNILMMCTSGDMDISLLYLKDTFGFSLTLFGYLKGLDNFLRGIIMITFVPLLKRLTYVRDLPLVMFGFMSYVAYFVLLGAAQAKWMVFLAVVVGMFKGIPSAGLRATMSSLVSSDEQGRLFGLIAASESITTLLASVAFNDLYPATRHIFPGLCYMLGAGLLFIIFLVIMYVHHILPQATPSQPYTTIENDADVDDGRVLASPAADDTDGDESK